LLSRAGGAAYYDDVQDITWLADASYALTSGYDTDVHMSWNDAQTFIATVNAANYLGVSTWRLPSMDVNGDAYLVFCSQAAEAECLDTELGYMGFVNGILPDNQGPFINVTGLFWSSTDYDAANTEWPDGRTCNAGPSGYCAWREGFPVDSQNYVRKTYDGYGVWLVADGDVLRPLERVAIDAKPGSDPKCGGAIPVAILGSDELDVTQIDQTTLAFEDLVVRERPNGWLLCDLSDVNRDGFVDLLCHYQNATTDGTLTGALLDGTRIEGSDTICVVP
jgi:hypothetical protein